jgi:hypothetical protein
VQRPGIGLAGRIAAALVAVLLLPSVARSQAAAPSPSPWGLFSARYDTRTSDFIYAVYGVGNTFGMVGVLHNPRSDYSEVLGGVGRNFRIAAGPTQTVALGVADASDAWYAQVYVLPALRRGPLWVRATSELYVPLERAGTVQFSVSPVSATLALSHLLEAGVSMDLSVAQNAAASTAAGPEIRVALPKAVLGADLQKDLGHAGGRFRMFFLGSF